MKRKDNVYQFLYKREKPVLLKWSSLIVGALGLALLVATPALAVLVILASITLFYYNTGVELDFGSNNYRLIHAFGSEAFGDWQDLPPLKCVSVFKTNLVNTTYSRANSSITTRDEFVKVSLVSEQNKRIVVFDCDNREEAIAFAQEVAQKLELKIWDATEREGKWLN